MFTQELIKNHDWKEDYITIPQKLRQEKSQGRNRKGKKLLPNILTDNIIELNELIYAKEN